MAPAETPAERVEKLRKAFASLYEDKSFLRLKRQLGENLNYMDGIDYEQVRTRQRESYQGLVKQLVH